MRSKSRLLSLFCSFCCCWSLNHEGVALLRFKDGIVGDPSGALENWVDEVGVGNPCSWFGVSCSDGHVIALNLKDLRLNGAVAPELGHLIHLKSIILRNNSFTGVIPREIADLKELEVLDLRYNDFGGQLPCRVDDPSRVLVLLDNNELLDSSGRGCKPSRRLVVSWKSASRKLLQRSPRKRPIVLHVLPLASPPRSVSPAPAPTPFRSPSPIPPPVIPASPPMPPESSPPSKTKRGYIISAAIGGPLFILLLIIGICYRCGKVSTVKPWATGLSGQLQRAFITGVPKLKRCEIEVACENFSNVIGSLTACTLYKGTLSSGVEIAVVSMETASKKEWSSCLESQFTKKIDMLSKVNHKNFVNLLGYCVQENPFTRMLVFEYAPNGTLFEHLHIKEAEHLDWEARMRIAMGIAYCLDYMHRSTPPLAHRCLTSSSIYLSEDNAAQISDFVFREKGAAAESQPTLQSNVYSFGVLLSEIITGKLPSSDHLIGGQPLRETVDPTLTTYNEDQLQKIEDVISSCVNPERGQRPSMGQVCARLREITGISPDGAVPKLSPLWWAELEIMSSEIR